MVRLRLSIQSYAIVLAVSLALAFSQSFAIETVRGVLKQNQVSVCGNHCDDYYLQPDGSISTINVTGNGLNIAYVDQHVEIKGGRISCGGCL